MIRRVALALLVVAAIAASVLWIARRPIADNAIAGALAGRGVPARYKVAEIGFGWQRLENISIGDPARPDLTADWAEVRLVAGLGGVTVDAVRAGGVRLRGRWVDGKVRWGALDALLPQAEGGPFALPALDVTLHDARVGLETPWGQVGARLEGRGRLDDGFRGKLAAVMPGLRAGGCTVVRATAWVDIAVARGAPTIRGPVRADSVTCSGVVLSRPQGALDVALGPQLDGWRGIFAPEIAQLSARRGTANAVRGRMDFAGTLKKGTTGRLRLASPVARVDAILVAGVRVDGSFAFGAGGFDWRGTAGASHVALPPQMRRSLAGLGGAARGTPLAPLLDSLGAAASRAAADAAVSADLALKAQPGSLAVNLVAGRVASASGALLRIGGGKGIGFDGASITADTRVTLSGGGIPAIAADVQRGTNGESYGVARVAPYAAGGARIALAPLRFRVRDNGAARVTTVAMLDGPVGGGRIEGLRTPLALVRFADGSLAANPGCAPLQFDRLAVRSLRLGPTALRICPEGAMLVQATARRISGGARLEAPRLTGFIGKTPLALAASRARIGLGDGTVALVGLAVRLGSGDRLSRLDVAQLGGTLKGGAIAGPFAGLSGQIGRVPLLIGGGAGSWRFAAGALELRGTATLSDDNPAPRFNPLSVNGLELRLADNRIVATGSLQDPKTGTRVAAVDIAHDLGAGTGRATLDVADLRFDDRFQPEMITRFALGVVANVRGAVGGRGDIRWSLDGVTSTGRFSTPDLDFAAAFGPVTGARGTIVFTDLLGLETAPGQIVMIDTVNPGIPVLGGQIAYHLAAGQKIAIEGGRWPFAGGTLLLEPAVLDMGEERERRLAFRVEGLDAAKFVEELKFENLAATGTFDGRVPIIFNAYGGRIEGGEIAARAGGGTIGYVGEVSNAAMNPYAKYAFDTLKSLRYRSFAIGLEGPLDGDMVTRLTLRGVTPLNLQKSFILRQLRKIPLRLNITIRAPFRTLFNCARVYGEPILALRDANFCQRRAEAVAAPAAGPSAPIQPAESEKRP